MSTVESILLEKGPDVIGVRADATICEAVGKMMEANVGCLIVEDDGLVVGIFTERDLLRRVVGNGKDPAAVTVAEVMSSPVRACDPADDVGECFDALSTNEYRHLIVLDGDEPVGVISLRDVALALRQAG